jgi:hypothetical protein
MPTPAVPITGPNLTSLTSAIDGSAIVFAVLAVGALLIALTVLSYAISQVYASVDGPKSPDAPAISGREEGYAAHDAWMKSEGYTDDERAQELRIKKRRDGWDD